MINIVANHIFRPYGRLSKYFKDYFPIELVKTADLNPDGKYLLCSHPHGTIPAGINIATATNYCGWNEKFPGTYSILLHIVDNINWPQKEVIKGK